MEPFQITLLILATWRLSYMLVSETGPFSVFATLRYYVGAAWNTCNEQRKSGEITNVLCCVYCTSLWVSALLYLLISVYPPFWIIITVLAISAGAIVLERLTTKG